MRVGLTESLFGNLTTFLFHGLGTFPELVHGVENGVEILAMALHEENKGSQNVQEKADEEGDKQSSFRQILEQQEQVVAVVEVGLEGVVLG